MTETLPGVLEWGVATLALAGEDESGDLHVVRPSPGGALLVAIDGLGHGPEAAIAARTAADVCARNHDSLSALFAACHAALRKTRGVVMSAARIDAVEHRLEWVGVGNIEGTLLRADGSAREVIMLFGGIAGHQLPKLRATTTTLAPGDVLLFATDGLRGDYASGVDIGRPPQEVADQVLSHHNKGSDDALVLVARYLGGGS